MDNNERQNRVAESNTPFYQQQGIAPPMSGKSLLHDQSGRPIYKPPQHNVNTDPRPPANRVAIRGTSNQNVANNAQQNHAEQMPVHVGNHEEHMWYNAPNTPNAPNATNVPQTNPKPYINEDYIDTNSLQGLDPLGDIPHKTPEEVQYQIQMEKEYEAYKYQQAQQHQQPQQPQHYQSQQQPQQQPQQPQQQPQTHQATITGLEEGQMCVVVSGDPVYSSDDEAHISRCVEDIMLNYNVPIEKISVFKKLNLNFGVKLK